MSAGLSFGTLPSFADLDPATQAMVVRALQQQGQPATAPQPSPTGLLGQVDPQGAGMQPAGPDGLPQGGAGGNPPVAMSEADTRRFERQTASPQDLAALDRPPSANDLVFNGSGLGGRANGFTGQADPYGSRPTPLPPGRPSPDDLLAPTATGSVAGLNPGAGGQSGRQVIASSSLHPEMAGNGSGAMPPGGRPPGAAPVGSSSGTPPMAGAPGGLVDFDPLTGARLSPAAIGQPAGAQDPVSATGAAQATGQAAGQGRSPSILQQFANGLNNPDFGSLLLHVGMGLMGTRGFGPGISAGLQGYEASQQRQSANDILRARFGMEATKFQQAQGALNQTALLIQSRAKAQGTAVPYDQAVALAQNPTYVNQMLARQPGGDKDPAMIRQDALAAQLPPSGFEANPQGGLAPTPGGPQSIEYKKAAAEAVAPDKTVRPLNDPAERAKYGIAAGDVTPYQVNADGRVEAVPGSAGGNRAREDVTKGINEDVRGSYQKAQGAVGTLAAISRQKEALDKGVIAGAGADWRTQAQSIGAQLLGIDPSQLNASYNFDAASTQKQAELAKAVSQAGHTTNMDLQLGKTIAGGDRSKTEQALRQIVDAQETLARHAITTHNDLIGRAQKISPDAASQYGFYGIEMPDVYRYGQGTPNPLADPGARLPAQGSAQQAPALPAGSPTGTRLAPDGRYYAPDPNRPGKYLMVR